MAGVAAKKTEKLVDRFEELLHAAHEASEENVHRVRTTARRIEAVMLNGGFERTPKAERVLKSIGVLRKQAGKVRDLDVQRSMVEGIAMESGQQQKDEVVHALLSSRAKQARKLVKKVGAAVDDGLLSDLGELTNVARRSRGERAGAYVDRALDEFADVAARFPELNESNLHEFRIACRRVRYVAEIAESIKDGKRTMELVKALQDAIGTWHDWTELAQTASDLLGRNAPLVGRLRAHRKSAFHNAIFTARKQRDTLLELRDARQNRRGRAVRRKAPSRAMTSAQETRRPQRA
jgi:CHAD domain-containing protein